MTEPLQTDAAPQGPIPLNRTQRRVLGVLIEKAFCTPEYYPMTINAIVTGCNQKSNRDPVVNLSSMDAEDALTELQQAGLTTRVYPATGRAERWRHNIKDVWTLDRPQRAILGELLLRGTQTEGDLRSRASRMVDIPTLEELRTVLDDLADRGFVKRLSPEGQRRGVLWTHLLMSEKELDREEEAARNSAASAEASSSPAPTKTTSPTTTADGRPNPLEADVESLKQHVASLEQRVDELVQSQQELARRLQTLQEELGN